MIFPLLAKPFKTILEKKISNWIDENKIRAKYQAGFRDKHLTIDHILTFRIIAQNCHNNKEDIFSCFVDFKKSFNNIPWDRHFRWYGRNPLLA